MPMQSSRIAGHDPAGAGPGCACPAPAASAGGRGRAPAAVVAAPLIAAALLIASAVAPAVVPTVALAGPEPTGLPLPRFVSLESGEVNLRTGPGFQYPVEWVYRRKALPVEIVAEYRNWRKIRDWQGDEGWMHKNMLSGRRSVIVTGDAARVLRADPGGAAIARTEPGAIGRLQRCLPGGDPCLVRFPGYEGWLDRHAFWGAYPDETVE